MTRRIIFWFTLFILILSACQLDPRKPVAYFLPQTPTSTATMTPTSSPTPFPTNTPTVTPTPTDLATSTPSATPTIAPPPTITPIPSDRLSGAQQAFRNGNYASARQLFDAILVDSGALPAEQRQALHWRGRSELQLDDTAAAIATFKLFLTEYTTGDLVRTSQFNLGLAYEKSGRFAEAMNAYRGAISPDDLVNAYIYERMGDLALEKLAYDQALTAFQNGVESTEDVGLQIHLREGVATTLLALDEPGAAIVQYEAILAVAQIDSYRAKILRLAGEAHQQMEDEAAAIQRFQEALDNYPEAPDSYLSLRALVNAGVAVDDFQRGLVDYHAQAYQPAINAFDRFMADTAQEATTASQAALIADALWYKGLSWLALGRYNSGIITLQQLIDTYPKHTQWGQAHLEIGKARVGQDNVALAKSVFRDFATRNPDDPLAPEALWRAARLELDGYLLSEAHINLRDLAQRHPVSDFTTDALYWAGRAAYLQGDYEAAIETWSILLEDYPRSNLASFGGYWQARTMLEQGQDVAAEQLLTKIAKRTNEYYGLRARDLLTGVPPHTVPLTLPNSAQLAQEQAEAEAWLADWLGLSPATVATLKPEVATDPTFQRGRLLLEFGLRDEAVAEFEATRRTWREDPLAMYQLSRFFSKQGANRLSIMSAAQLIFLSPAEQTAAAPIYIQRLNYPFPFPEIIMAEAEDQQIDPALILAIMRQESLFEPQAESRVGARGLMQVMPPTGEYIADRSNFSDFNLDQLWLPYISIKFGAWYIEQQLAIFDGNQFAALAAYNAGPGNVLEWIKISEDLDIFVESIPFRESRTYVRRIYVNLAEYRRIYGSEEVSASN